MLEKENILLQRFAATGDAEAFSQIVQRHAPLVYGSCIRILGDRESAADAAQETFFQLIGEQDGRYHPIFDDESLGSYAYAWQAAEDLAGGHTFSISSGIDTSTLGIPYELGEWEKLNEL